jgi:hypothetical protein
MTNQTKQYCMNPNYTQKVWKYLDKLLNAKIIYFIETIQWLSNLVIVPGKNGKLCISMDY